MERFFGFGSVATGAAITMLNLHLPGAGPTTRPRLYEIGIGCGKNAPADIAAHYTLGRTTAIGTEDAGFIPVNLDPDGPAAQSDLGVGFTGGEPTYTANAELMSISMNQRATYRWVAAP